MKPSPASENNNLININGSSVNLTFSSKIYIPKNCANWKYTFVNNGEEKLSIFVILETLGGEEIDRNGTVGVAKGISQTDSIRVCSYQFPKRKKGKTYSLNLNLRVAEYNGGNNIFTKKIKAYYK
jgi:hypothetical protein